MNAIILDSAASFNAVQYNTDKMDTGRGELMAVRNLGIFNSDKVLAPEDVRKYFQGIAKLNPRVSRPQFHAAISCRGRENTKVQLTEAAHRWMAKMGYGDNPYIVVFHKDSGNNHVHIVSTRVGLDGRKIRDSFEHLRAVKHIREVSAGLQAGQERGITDKLDYRFTTVAQFRMLHEAAGAKVMDKDGTLTVYHDGRQTGVLDADAIAQQASGQTEDPKRLTQIKALFRKYGAGLSAHPVPIHATLKGGRQGPVTRYTSELAEHLHRRFGIQLVYHFNGDKPPYGYSVIDHKGKSVFKGASVMKLSAMLGAKGHATARSDGRLQGLTGYNTESMDHVRLLARRSGVPAHAIPLSGRTVSAQEYGYYRDLLAFYLRHHGLEAIGGLDMELARTNGKWYVIDLPTRTILEASRVLPPEEYAQLTGAAPNAQVLSPGFGRTMATAASDATGMAAAIAPEPEDNRRRRKKKNT